MYYGAQVMVILWLFPVGIFIVIPLLLLIIHLVKMVFLQTSEVINRNESAVEPGAIQARLPSGAN